ncbi:MAG: VOC family protein [Calditrichia bacterium]
MLSQKSLISRREFLKRSSAAAMLLALHDTSLFAETLQQESESKPNHLIRSMELQTVAPLSDLRTFYSNKLGFSILDESDKHLTLAGGKTTITFLKVDTIDSFPWYHFAFNIPQNQILSAREWHLKRGPLIETPPHQRDPDYPNDVRHFRHWNAHSLFFWDPAGNLVEYIARHELDNDSESDFSVGDIHYASEIGFIVEDQQEAARQLNKAFGLSAYPKETNFWWAMGDADGLLLCLPKGREWGEFEGRTQKFSEYPTNVTINGSTEQEFAFAGLPYSVKVEKA